MIKSAPETGLVRFGYRDYDATSGRWLSNDPIGINGGLNQYVFVGNNPVNNSDPFGLVTGIDDLVNVSQNGVVQVSVSADLVLIRGVHVTVTRNSITFLPAYGLCAGFSIDVGKALRGYSSSPSSSVNLGLLFGSFGLDLDGFSGKGPIIGYSTSYGPGFPSFDLDVGFTYTRSGAGYGRTFYFPWAKQPSKSCPVNKGCRP
mgnify:CR=1 FL=1